MIRYDLVCAEGHRFDGWFQNSAAFEVQQKRGAMQCPLCASTAVDKALMTPGVPAKANRLSDPGLSSPDQKGQKLREAFKLLRRHVEETADYVGDEFAEEARRIHYKESEERGIYGEATLSEARELREEGIDVLPLPPAAEEQN